MPRVWQIQEAKNKLSEVVEEAIQTGPQILSRRGAEIAVVLSYEEYLKLKKSRTNLAQFFLESPLPDSHLDLTTDRRPAGRDSSLSATSSTPASSQSSSPGSPTKRS